MVLSKMLTNIEKLLLRDYFTDAEIEEIDEQLILAGEADKEILRMELWSALVEKRQ